MEPFKSLRAVALPIAQPNFDTDQILPARFLQKPRSASFGDFLFRDLRENPDFVLNKPAYRAARIVVADENFGCGSSREHAVWALYDYGIRAVIAPSMGDIFMSNAAKNGLLTILLPAAAVTRMLDLVLRRPGVQIGVDLEAQKVELQGVEQQFEIDAYRKRCLRSGLDELGYTLTQLEHIKDFEKSYEDRSTAG